MNRITRIHWPWQGRPAKSSNQEESIMFQMQQVGARIAALRRERDMTQMALADRMGVSHQAVSKWERGDSMPDIAALPQLAQVFGTTVDYLLSGNTPPSREVRIVDDIIEHGVANMSQPVNAEELAHVAPLLKPSQVREAVGSVKAFDLEQLAGLAPFLDRDLLDELVQKAANASSLEDVAAIAPFVSREVLDKLAQDTADAHSLEDIAAIAPFVSREVLDKLAQDTADAHSLEDVAAIAPFVSREVLDELARTAVGEFGLEGIGCLAPFINKSTLRELVLGVLSKGGNLGDLSDIAPFMKD